MTLQRFRELIDGLPDNLEVTIQTNDFVGTPIFVEMEHAHDDDDTPYLAVTCL